MINQATSAHGGEPINKLVRSRKGQGYKDSIEYSREITITFISDVFQLLDVEVKVPSLIWPAPTPVHVTLTVANVLDSRVESDGTGVLFYVRVCTLPCRPKRRDTSSPLILT